MGHMNFDNLVKISRKEEIREMPEILKPTRTFRVENKQELSSRQRNTLQQKHWRLYTLLYVNR